MERLFKLAEMAHEANPERSDRYVQIARNISTRTRVRMPRRLKRLFCRNCGAFLTPSGIRVRLSRGLVVVTCLACKEQMRQPFRPQRPQTGMVRETV